MKRIAIVTNIPAPYRVALYSFLNKKIDEMDFYIIYTNKSEKNRNWQIKDEELLNSTILHSKVIRVKTKTDYRYIHIVGNIFKVLERIDPEVVIAMEYNIAALKSLVWSKLKKKKFIHLTDGTLNSERYLNGLQKMSRKLICRYADSFIASSTKAKEKLMKWGVPESKIFISLLTVDINSYMVEKKRFSDKNIILYVGSYAERKGIDLLFEALSLVGNGNAHDRERLYSLAKKLNIYEKIMWLGYLEGEAIRNEYEQASIFVLPTREDCFGLVLLEALCSKTPIIASKYADGAYDIINQNENGIIVDPFDKVEFGKALRLILTDKRLRKLYSENCHNNISKFNFENVAKGYIDAINSVID